MSDILFCIIPALSAKDLLPNRAMFQLISPRNVLKSGWIETAHCYDCLLDSDMKAGESPERYCVSMVIMVMDFLYLTFQPYDEKNKPHDSLETALCAMIKKLADEKFDKILALLAIAYEFQGRRQDFKRIFEFFHDKEAARLESTGLRAFRPKKISLQQKTMLCLESLLEYPRAHQRLCRQYAREMETIEDENILDGFKDAFRASEYGELKHNSLSGLEVLINL